MLAALERLIHRLLRNDDEDALDDDVGDVQRPPSASPTASAKGFKRPDPTPSMREYRTPRPTPGMAGYRAPKQTPSTGRISSSTRPLGAGERPAAYRGGR
jgi:hypothetical protein